MPETLGRQIVERGFYMAWDAPRVPGGAASGTEAGAEPAKPEIQPIIPEPPNTQARSN